MTTGTVGTNARQDPRQVVNTLKKTVNFNDAGITTGVAFANYLPRGAFLSRVLVEVITAFNAVTTNVLTVGTNSPGYDNIVGAGDVPEGVTGVVEATRGYGRSICNLEDKLPVAMYTQSGTAATTGQAMVLIEYEGGWDT